MAIVKHSVSVLDGSSAPAFTDRMIVAQQLAVANVVGSAAGASVSTVVTFTEPLPSAYTVMVAANQDSCWYITAKTTYGFTVVLNPRLAANTLAAGTFDVTVVAA